MTERIWLATYPEGVPADIDASQYPSLVALIEEAFAPFPAPEAPVPQAPACLLYTSDAADE